MPEADRLPTCAHHGRVSIELQESRPGRRVRVVSASPPTLDMIRKLSGPCSNLVWVCKREGLPISKPLVVGKKKIDGLAVFEVYDTVHGVSVARNRRSRIGESRRYPGFMKRLVGQREPVHRHPFPPSSTSNRTSRHPLCARRRPYTPCLRFPLHLASFLSLGPSSPTVSFVTRTQSHSHNSLINLFNQST